MLVFAVTSPPPQATQPATAPGSAGRSRARGSPPQGSSQPAQSHLPALTAPTAHCTHPRCKSQNQGGCGCAAWARVSRPAVALWPQASRTPLPYRSARTAPVPALCVRPLAGPAADQEASVLRGELGHLRQVGEQLLPQRLALHRGGRRTSKLRRIMPGASGTPSMV